MKDSQMESELRSKARSSVIQINYAAFSMLKSQGTYEEIQKRAGFQEPNIKGDLMALEELFVPNLPQMYWGDPLRWHKLFGHSFRFPKGVLASPSRRRGLGKGTAFESLSPVAL